MARYQTEVEVREESIEDLMALGGEALDFTEDLERLERFEMGKVAVAHAAIYQANRAEDHSQAWGIIETAVDQIELLSEDSLSDLSLLRQALLDQRIYAALIAKHGSPELKAKKALADEHIANRHAARRAATRRIHLSLVRS